MSVVRRMCSSSTWDWTMGIHSKRCLYPHPLPPTPHPRAPLLGLPPVDSLLGCCLLDSEEFCNLGFSCPEYHWEPILTNCRLTREIIVDDYCRWLEIDFYCCLLWNKTIYLFKRHLRKIVMTKQTHLKFYSQVTGEINICSTKLTDKPHLRKNVSWATEQQPSIIVYIRYWS